MIKLKLKKARSYTGVVSATKEKPYVTVKDEATANAAVASGFFEVVELNAAEEQPELNTTGTITKLGTMTVAQLKEYAKTNDIDLDGASKKEEILERIEAAQAGANDDDPASQFTGGSNEGDGGSE
ncbi:SAP domain-containing protein [Clostridium sp. D33t1_170424_F3]|uniref:SAP domain-containing protein n=1 Tax=Clostridium sp. D33t1_170424_F3 TaxID=2787099 RepID=UPI0018A9A9D4|nr:SAP domain-containing protein [Clostridium sp. D33t1_170424_F3]